ncbi:MAG: hypothetical protein IKI70_00945, partial [Bacteroidales bacterium]|nr:hypothetical protein [Bacteroidales bacterium]
MTAATELLPPVIVIPQSSPSFPSLHRHSRRDRESPVSLEAGVGIPSYKARPRWRPNKGTPIYSRVEVTV